MEYQVAIIGLGYVGLPLAVESGKYYPTLGFDLNHKRIEELNSRYDRTLEVSSEEIQQSGQLRFSSEENDLQTANYYIVTVPTPVDEHKQPDLGPLTKAAAIVGKYLSTGDIVVFESTVFPGCTEEVCVPILSELSGLKYNEGFYCGYSPERINPGDKTHRLTNILKVTSGSTHEVADRVDHFYRTLIPAGTHKTSSIKVAEAAKVIENAQRDINIAFVNELSMIFDKMDIDTTEVLEAAGTKWNFLPFTPGLVGGHCIGVDPFYLTFKAEALGYQSQVILAGRKINDQMGMVVAQRIIKLLGQKNRLSYKTRVLILGITFKENCPDIRNSRVIDIYQELGDYGMHVDVCDPQADSKEVFSTYGFNLVEEPDAESYDCVVLAVSHASFKKWNWQKIHQSVAVIYDVKAFLPKEFVTSRL